MLDNFFPNVMPKYGFTQLVVLCYQITDNLSLAPKWQSTKGRERLLLLEG